MVESRFFLPALDDGLYPQSEPFCRHLKHNGLPLLHLTLATKQLSQDSRSLMGLGGAADESCGSDIVAGDDREAYGTCKSVGCL